MTPIERQILENQRYILIALCQLSDNEEVQGWLDNRTAETMNLLKEKESNEPCCEMPEEKKGWISARKDFVNVSNAEEVKEK